jgi:homoserine dehydrogenase
MGEQAKIVVLKFGSSVLRNEADLPSAVHEIYRWWRNGVQVIAVVSAFGDTTDQLMRLAERICDRPHLSVLPSLLATGEATASALLALTLAKAGIPTRLLDEVQVDLRTDRGGIDSSPVSVDAARLLNESRHAVVVLPGFLGRDENGDRTLLGRGGSDLTALFLAQQLNAQCVLVKDVDGLYTSDPASSTIGALRFKQACYDTALRVGGPVVQEKAVRFAAANNLRFSITSIGAHHETVIGPVADTPIGPRSSAAPLRVALLGCGVVGGGVFQRLVALPELFTVTGVGTRKVERARSAGVPGELITEDLEALVNRPCDVVVELIGGTTRAASLVEQSLKLGRNVVTANKALLAHSQAHLEALAKASEASLRYSAAVGGVLPALEIISRVKADGPWRRFSGVLNGTCNFVLEQLAAGSTLSDAVQLAQAKGYAEEDPKLDLDGIDAAQKLILLARAAFDINLPLHLLDIEGISGVTTETMRQAGERNRTVRLVAECRQVQGEIEASVAPVELPLSHPLAQVKGAENRLILEPEVGEPIVVSGTGAGRWPTTEAVLADLFEVRVNQQRNNSDDLSEELEVCVA